MCAPEIERLDRGVVLNDDVDGDLAVGAVAQDIRPAGVEELGCLVGLYGDSTRAHRK